jgi:hypothetical protein
MSEADALDALKSAKTLSRRLGVSYKELTDIVQTSFVNPELDDLSIVWKLRIGVGNVVQYLKEKDKPEYAEEKKAFEERLEALLTETSSELKLDDILVKLNELKSRFQRALVLRDTSALCNFDETYLEFADPADPSKPYADALVFYKINLFVRLWKKLGWTMEETDRTLQVFLPKNSLPLTGTNIGEALKIAVVYLAHLKALDEQVKIGKNSRLKLLTLWANLPTTGKNPLYRQLFLTRSILKNDPVFDDPLGNYLSKVGIFVKDHLLALQAALNLTADEIGQILSDAGKNPDTVELSLDTVSLLYRYGLLAKALNLPVRDLIALKGLSDLDPVKPLSADPLTKLDDDYPYGQTLRFVEIAETIKESGFKIEDLEYLLRHRFDPVGKYRPSAETPLSLVKTLAAEIRRIRAEHAIPADPLSLTDDLLRQKMALVLPPDVVEKFLSMWTGSVVYEAEIDAQPANQLDAAAFAEEPAIRVSYDDVRQKQRLAFRGMLLDTEKKRLKDAHSSPLFGALLDLVQEKAKPFKEFFKSKLEKYQVTETRPGGYLDASDFDLLFAPIPPIPDGLSEADKQTRREVNEELIRQKRKKLAEVFLPFLQKALVRQLIVQTLAANLSADPALTEALLTEASLLSDPGQAGKPLLDAFAGAGERGVNVAFFASPDGTGDPLPPKMITVASVDTALKDANEQPIKPANAQSARFEGYIEVPAAGAYRFFMVFGKKDAEAELHLYTQPETVIHHKAGSDGQEISDPGDFVELKPGVPYRFALHARNLGGSDVALLVQGESLPKDSLVRLAVVVNIVAAFFTCAVGLLLGFPAPRHWG